LSRETLLSFCPWQNLEGDDRFSPWSQPLCYVKLEEVSSEGRLLETHRTELQFQSHTLPPGSDKQSTSSLPATAVEKALELCAQHYNWVFYSSIPMGS